MAQVLPTQVNGTYPDHSNVVIRIPGAADLHVTSINYERTVTREGVRVNGRRTVSGFTSGDVEYSADFELLKPDASDFLKAYATMGPDASFNIIVTYSLPPSTQNPVPLTITDSLQGCKLDGITSSSSTGGSPVNSTINLMVSKILFNGLDLDGQVI